jgi:CHAT domain-containing protein
MEQLAGIHEPALVLSVEPGKEPNARWLTASKIEAMSIDAGLVILSACNSGFTESSEGADRDQSRETMSALVKAFFEAGARGVMASHWTIDSEQTVSLLKILASVQGSAHPSKGIAETLREAMLAQIRSTNHPRDWAMFSYIGE